jgi:hypothetical protein
VINKFWNSILSNISFRIHATIHPIDGGVSVANHSPPPNAEVKEIGKWRKIVLYTVLPRNHSGGIYILSHLHAAGRDYRRGFKALFKTVLAFGEYGSTKRSTYLKRSLELSFTRKSSTLYKLWPHEEKYFYGFK